MQGIREESLFHLVVWWLLSLSIFLLVYIPLLNQIVLKAIIPILFLLVVVREKKINIDKGLWLYIAITLWGCLSLFYSINISMSLRYLQMLVGNIIIWYIAARCIKNIENLRQIFYPLLLAIIVQAYFTLTATIIAPEKVIEENLARVSGLSNNENDEGRLLFLGSVASIWFVTNSRNKIFKVLNILLVIMFMISIFRTGSRGALLAVLIMIYTFTFLKSKKSNYKYIIIGLIATFLFYYFFYDTLLNNTAMGHRIRIGVELGKENSRYELIMEGIGFFLKYPLLGVGLGSYTTYSVTHHYSHNDFVEISASMGFPAFLIYIGIYFDYWKKVRAILRKAPRKYLNTVLISFSFLIAFLFVGVSDPIFYYPATMLMLAVFYSLVVKLYGTYMLNNQGIENNIVISETQKEIT